MVSMTWLFGEPKGGGKAEWRNEKVTSASYYTRPKEMKLAPFNHDGVVVNTDKGNSFLIHHPGSCGSSSGRNNPGVTTVTPASNMSTNWTKVRDIPVVGNKTVQTVYNGAGGRSNYKIVNYLTATTCWGAAAGAEKTLKK